MSERGGFAWKDVRDAFAQPITGIYGGSTWHLEDPTSWTGKFYLTLCGKRSQPHRTIQLRSRGPSRLPTICRTCSRLGTRRPVTL